MESIKSGQQSFETLFLFLSLFFLVSLLYSLYFLSICFFCFALLALWEWEWRPFSIRWRTNTGAKLNDFVNQPAWWVVTLPFFLVLFGGLYSDDTGYWISRMRIKAPFLLAPIAFYLLPSISRLSYQRIHVMLVVLLTLSTLPILYRFITDFSGILEGLRMGQAIETPGRHIRYSLMLSLACISSFILWIDRVRINQRTGPSLFLYTGIYLFIFTHMLAVRSGIGVLYFTGFLFVLKAILTRQHLKLATIAGLILLSAPVVAYLTFPSFSQRIQYMFRDVSQYQKQEWNAYSDAERILSVRAGLALGKDAPWLGVGPGDLRQEMKSYFYQEYDKDTFLLPHNQFISVFTANGLIGLALLLLALFLPLLSQGHFKDPYFLAANSILLSSLIVENTFETSVGVALYIFFLMIGLNHLKTQNSGY